MQRLHAVVSGRVQGVCFRAYTVEEARGLGLRGFVRNCDDGSVELEAEGPREALDRLVLWLERGSPASHVTSVSVMWTPATGAERGFTIR